MSLFGWTLLPVLLLHVWLYRRNAAAFRFQLVLDVILAVVVGPALVVVGDLNPVRCLEQRPPFRHIEWSPHTQLQPTQRDVPYQFHPWWEEAGEQLRRGELPRIHPGIGAGLPLLANGQSGLWAPVMLPVWLHGPERGTTIMAFWKLEVAGLGAFFLFYVVLRLRWAAAAVGGIAWAGTPYLVGWLLVPLAWAVALLPLTWWAAWWMGLRRTRLRNVVLVGLGFGWLMGSGLHPETASIVCGSALVAACCLHPRRWRRIVVVVAVAGLTALVLSWPTVGYISASSRAAMGAHGEANREGLEWSVQSDLAQQIAVPAAMGHPGRGDWRPVYPHAPGAAGVGGVILVLLASGRMRRRFRMLAVASGISTAIGLILLLRIPPFDQILVRVPPINQMTVPRFGVLIPWGLTVLAALAFDGALRGRTRSVTARLMPAIVLAAAVLSAAPWLLAPIDTVLVCLSVAMAVTVVFLNSRRLILAMVVAELGLLAIGINPVASADDRLPRPQLMERLVELETEGRCRIIGTDRVFGPNLASRYDLRDLRASDPLRPAPFARLMGVLGEPVTVLGGPLQRLPAGLCGAWGVGLAVTRPGREVRGWQREYADRDGVIWSNPVLLPEVRVVGRVIEEPDDAQTLHGLAGVIDFATAALVGPGASNVDAEHAVLELARRSPTSVEATVECDGPCLVVVAQPWAPGWQASVDGVIAPMVRTNVAGLGVVAPVGHHVVAFEYRPWAWRNGVP